FRQGHADAIAASTQFRVDGTGTLAPYTHTFTLPGGSHVIEVQSQTPSGTLEALETYTVFVDTVPPASALSLSGPRWIRSQDGALLVSSQTTLSLQHAHP